MCDPATAVLVLNYNGGDLLARCLPSVVKAVENAGPHCRLVVVDNRSTDDSIEFLEANFPTVDIVLAAKNDFLFSLNDVVRECQEEIVIILNNDMEVAPDFIEHLQPYFSSPEVFAVTCRIFNWNGVDRFETTPESICTLFCKGGWFHERYDTAPDYSCFVQLASGGASAFRRTMFCELGGFDRLFQPAYYEDTDLSYRAWQRGWRIIYEPRSRVFHLGSASMKKHAKMHSINRRNSILMAAKLLGDWHFVLRFVLLYPKRMLQHCCWGDRELGRALLAAVPRLPRALARRVVARGSGTCYLLDAEIETFMNTPCARKEVSPGSNSSTAG